MTTRRKFLGVAATMSTLPIASRLLGSPATAAPLAHQLHTVVLDRRWQASRDFANAADPSGLSHAAIVGDMTDLWFTALDPHWRTAEAEAPVALAGLTAHGPIFCLEELAREHALRVVYRGVHEPIGDGLVRHRFWGAVPDLAATSSWAASVGRTVNTISVDAAPVRFRAPADLELTTRVTPPSETLISWLIAPVLGA